MASLQACNSHGIRYYRIVESFRKEGKPSIRVLAHLGRVDEILHRHQLHSEVPVKISSVSAGAVTALFGLARELDVAGRINRALSGGGEVQVRAGLTVGESLLIAMIARACAPRSKRAFADWAGTTWLPELMKFAAADLTSQHFWDQMNVMPLDKLPEIEQALVQEVVRIEQLQLQALAYDTTNFYTHIASTNLRAELPQRGHNKQGRHDLRQMGLALVVDQVTQLPLAHALYEGARSDMKTFAEFLKPVRKRLSELTGQPDQLTLVFDASSRRNLEGMQHYVTAVRPSSHRALLEQAAGELSEVQLASGATARAWRTNRVIAGLGHDLVEDVDIMHFTVCNAYKGGNIAVQVKQGMHLYRAFAPAKFRPWKQGEAEVDGGRIESIESVVQIHADRISDMKRSGDADQVLREIGEDAPVVGFVGVSQSGSRDPAAESHVVQLVADRSQTRLDVAKAFAIGELSEGHRQKLVPTRQLPMVAVTVIASHALLKIEMGQLSDQLREDGSTDIHPPLFRQSPDRPLANFQPFSAQIVFWEKPAIALTTMDLLESTKYFTGHQCNTIYNMIAKLRWEMGEEGMAIEVIEEKIQKWARPVHSWPTIAGIDVALPAAVAVIQYLPPQMHSYVKLEEEHTDLTNEPWRWAIHYRMEAEYAWRYSRDPSVALALLRHASDSCRELIKENRDRFFSVLEDWLSRENAWAREAAEHSGPAVVPENRSAP